MANLIIQAIEVYNNRQYKSLYRLTPNDMEAALFQKHQGKHSEELVVYTKDNNSPQALAIQHYKQTIIQEYQDNWEHFFIGWKIKQERQHKEVVTLIKKKAQQAQKQAELARLQYNTIYEQFLKVQQKLQVLQDQVEFQTKTREEKQLARLKKKQAKTLRIM